VNLDYKNLQSGNFSPNPYSISGFGGGLTFRANSFSAIEASIQLLEDRYAQ